MSPPEAPPDAGLPEGISLETSSGVSVLRVSFDGDERAYDGTAHGSMAVGSVQAWQVSGNDKHPFHIHINSFQLGSDVVDASGYYRTGDWHDVFYRPADVTASLWTSPRNQNRLWATVCHSAIPLGVSTIPTLNK